MLKKLLIILIVLVFFIFCKNNSKTAEQNIQQSRNITSVDSLLQFADSFVGDTVVTKGMVSHVCRMSGKKLFILGKNPDQMIKVTTGDNISQFDIALEGGQIIVKGEFVKELPYDPAVGHEKKQEKAEKEKVECSTEQEALYSIKCSDYKEL
ncbi:hypothetical protein JXQ31_04175 [candidate division KSB1 bacterium]|nr:hypothetical protein [candidate division KSB1 bacterium]